MMLKSSRTRLLPADIGIDFGTANTLVVERGSGVVFDEPSICCFHAQSSIRRFVAAGNEASRFVGRVTKPLEMVRPLRNGVLSEMNAARELLRFATQGQRRSWRLSRPHVMIGVPADATDAECRALKTAALDAGLSEPQLVSEPLLSAIGTGLDIDQPRGRMILDCGAGTTEVAVISLGKICVSQSVRGGSEALDRALADRLHLSHRFHIGTATAERLKLDLLSALDCGDTDRMLEIRGLDAAMGMPKVIAVRAGELAPIWEKKADTVVRAVRAALAETPPELSQDSLEDGIVVTGGAATTGLLARRIAEATGVPANVADSPLRSVAAGLGKLLDQGR